MTLYVFYKEGPQTNGYWIVTFSMYGVIFCLLYTMCFVLLILLTFVVICDNFMAYSACA